jgi:PhzF family phenazine biosynthesis protein
MYARHFSSPYSDTIEDSVTGTASGVRGAYYAEYINGNFENNLRILVEQGHVIGKDGRLLVKVSKNDEGMILKLWELQYMLKSLK